MRASARAACAAASIIALTACGGGGGTTGGTTPVRTAPNEVRTATGLSAPTETVADQQARVPAILSRMDSLLASTMYLETSRPDLPTLQLRARCMDTACTFAEPGTGLSQTVRLRDLESGGGDERTVALGSRHGITLMYYAEDGGASYGYGAWMQHSGFQVQVEQATDTNGYRYSGWAGTGGGDRTGSAPAGSATWQGLMVGTPVRGSHQGDRLQGEARVRYALGGQGAPTVAISFTGITNLERQAAHTVPTVSFLNVPVASGGTFEAGLTGNRVQGAFYGSAHAEAGGVFEQANIVGAFGAKKQ